MAEIKIPIDFIRANSLSCLEALALSGTLESKGIMCRIYPKNSPGDLMRFIDGEAIACLANERPPHDFLTGEWAVKDLQNVIDYIESLPLLKKDLN